MLDYLGKLLKQVNETPKIDSSIAEAANIPFTPPTKEQLAAMSEPKLVPPKPFASPLRSEVKPEIAKADLIKVETKPDTKPETKPEAKSETRPDRELRIKSDKKLDELLKDKFFTDINIENETPESEFLQDSKPAFKCGKEFDVILETIDCLKDTMLKSGTSSEKAVDITTADKSQLIFWVYKELRDQFLKNDSLSKQFSEVKRNLEQKTNKVDELQQEIKKVRSVLSSITSEHKKVLAQLHETNKRNQKLESAFYKAQQKYLEISKMSTDEFQTILKV